MKRLSEQIKGQCGEVGMWYADIKALEQRVTQLNTELEKWRNWKPDDEDLADMQEQAQCRDGSYNSGLAACGVYIGGLEYRVREFEAENERLIEIQKAASELAYNLNRSALYSEMKDTYYWLRDALEAYDALKEDV